MKNYHAVFFEDAYCERPSAHNGEPNSYNPEMQEQSSFDDMINSDLRLCKLRGYMLVLSEYVPPKLLTPEEYWDNMFMQKMVNLEIPDLYPGVLDRLYQHRDRGFFEEALVHLFPIELQGTPLPELIAFQSMQTFPNDFVTIFSDTE